MTKLTRRALLLGTGAVVGGLATHALRQSLPVLDGTAPANPQQTEGFLNDASGLSPTPVHRHVILTDDPGETLIAAIRAEMEDARANGRPVNVGAARHSMGAQAIPRLGHAINFDNGWVEEDTKEGLMQVHAGARWSQVIAALDPLGQSPRVMQSNNDFGVAATFCVNAHGWPVVEGPMGATVESLDMILPSGDLVTCSRDQNPQLFGMTMGGYGLTGAIVKMRVHTAPNLRLLPEFEVMPAEDFAPRFTEALARGDLRMAYGRLNVDRAALFREALMVTYREAADQSDLPAASGSGVMSHLARHIYRAQLGRERVKRLRWWTETALGPKLAGEATRNSLINEPVATLDDRDPARTDILHEYFVPPDRFSDFLTACREVIPASYQDFLNVTLRYVDSDRDSWLAYAPEPRIAAVMSFSQEMTRRAEADMMRMTQALIDRITAIGGTYYLPYRPHATPAQFTRAYPRAQEFVAAKRALDPGTMFRNGLWDNYMERL